MLAQYRGVSWLSRVIRWLTYSEYSHTAVLFTEDMEVESTGSVHMLRAGNVIEAWSPGGVLLSDTLSSRHTPGTQVDLFKFKTPLRPEQEHRIAAFLVGHLGKKYDYWNVLRFVPLVRAIIARPAPSTWTRSHVFCSELGLEAFAWGARPLLERCKAWEVPPRDPPRSPLLMLDSTMITE